MSEKDFSAGGIDFKIGKINAFKQFHIARRLAPILADMLPGMKKMQAIKDDNLTEDQRLDQIAEIAGPIMNGLSKLSDSDADFVLMGLLAAAELKQPTGNWARIVVDGRLMFDNLDLPTMLQVAGRVFMENIAGFFGALPQVSHGGR